MVKDYFDHDDEARRSRREDDSAPPLAGCPLHVLVAAMMLALLARAIRNKKG